MSWHKLKEMNDWGNRRVLIGKPHMSKPFNTWGISNEDGPGGTPFLNKEGTYKVRFPDGHEASLTMQMRDYTEHINDMGHEYSVNSREPYFITIVHGAKFAIKAMRLGVEVWRDD